MNFLSLILLTLANPISVNSNSILQFDLECVGNQNSNFAGKGMQSSNFRVRFSIDLATRLWAFKGDQSARKMHQVDPDIIIFEDSISKYSSSYISVNRVTGEFAMIKTLSVTNEIKTQNVSGTCSPLEFTPLPITRF